MKIFYRALIFIIVIITVGCGQKGPLFIPDEKSHNIYSTNNTNSH